jgi:restriction system protein
MVRAGSHGEYEQKFIEEGRIYVTWDGLSENLGALSARDQLLAAMTRIYDDAKPKTLQNWISQVWPFAHSMQKGDLVVVPLKTQSAICIGEIAGDYNFVPEGPDPFFHCRKVKWLAEAIPRSHFGQDLLYTFGAFMTICRVKRNGAEERIAKMRASGWGPDPLLAPGTKSLSVSPESDDAGVRDSNVEELAQDQIAQLITARFKGHGLERLVDAILRAQGYTTFLSPEGADGGVDIVAGAGLLGFGSPRLCVQVKSHDSPVEARVLNELRGAMQMVGATEGLLVSWSGFKSTVYRQLVTSFFSVRLWGRKELLEALFAHYDRLDGDLKAELPLKRIWTVAVQDE